MTESRRSWMTAEAIVADLRTVQSPSLRDVFRNGFLNGSMLQIAVCSPPRETATEKVEQPYAAVYVTRLGTKVASGSIHAKAATIEC